MTHRVDLVVPVYNERENFIGFYKYLANNLKSDWRIIVVYDFPEDSTLIPVGEISKTDQRVRAVKNTGRGVLGAIKTGFATAEAEAVLVTMVDDPEGVLCKIDEMTRVFYASGAAVVAASRYMKGGRHIDGPPIKRFLTRTASTSLRYLIRFPIHDATYNTKLYRKSFLDSLTFESQKGFEIALEITIKAYLRGEKLSEVPVIWSERVVGESRFHVTALLLAYLRWYLYGIREYYLGKKNSPR